jgi:diguanylate cyclase (GGDEF)-like protein
MVPMRSYAHVVAAAILGAGFVILLELPGLNDMAILLLSNLGQLAAAAMASVACALAARRSTGRRRASWAWLAIGTGSWAAGQAVWSYYEVILDREVPFPSLADLGFLGFPIAAAVGLMILLGTQSHELAARGRDVLDGAIIAGSLLVLSWVTALGTVVADGGDELGLTLSLAYPAGDLILGTLVLLALARGAVSERRTLAILALGLGGLAVSDSAYVYLVSHEAYSSADLVSSGWVVGFLFVGAAAATVGPIDAVEVERRSTASMSKLRLTLPYVPLVAALIALTVSIVSAPKTPAATVLLGLALMLVVLTRQFLAMVDNLRLVLEVQEARDQLEHQALHDALTGLPNRVLFADRLDRALIEQSTSLSVLFCDLDDFKKVNDAFGHATGDLALRTVADRLLACVRATDTVTRLSGDEFAILLTDSSDAILVAERVVSSLAEPIVVDDATVRISVSIGIAHHRGLPMTADDRRGLESRLIPPRSTAGPAGAECREASAELLLRRADAAMYAAKSAGKGQAVVADPLTGETPELTPLPV